jgi:enoyl-CoA hydratase/carnithine racemase
MLAGADIKELEKLTFVNAFMGNFLQSLADGIAAARKPIIAAVNGYAVSSVVLVYILLFKSSTLAWRRV